MEHCDHEGMLDLAPLKGAQLLHTLKKIVLHDTDWMPSHGGHLRHSDLRTKYFADDAPKPQRPLKYRRLHAKTPRPRLRVSKQWQKNRARRVRPKEKSERIDELLDS